MSQMLMGVVNEKGNVDIKTTTGSKSPLKTMNCDGQAVAVTQLLQENGRVIEVYVQCKDGQVRVFDNSGSIIRRR